MIKDQSGFTLTEILVAVVILGILAASFSSLFGVSLSSISGAGNRHYALVEAQDLLERALADPIMAGDGIHRQPETQHGVSGELITAKVIWQDGFGVNRELKLSVFQAEQSE